MCITNASDILTPWSWEDPFFMSLETKRNWNLDHKKQTANINGQIDCYLPPKKLQLKDLPTFGLLNLAPKARKRVIQGLNINDLVTTEHISCVFLTPKGSRIQWQPFIMFQRNQDKKEKKCNLFPDTKIFKF